LLVLKESALRRRSQVLKKYPARLTIWTLDQTLPSRVRNALKSSAFLPSERNGPQSPLIVDLYWQLLACLVAPRDRQRLSATDAGAAKLRGLDDQTPTAPADVNASARAAGALA
jgi:hypothetical protein